MVKKRKRAKRKSNAVGSVMKVLPAVIVTAGAIGIVSGLLSSKRSST